MDLTTVLGLIGAVVALLLSVFIDKGSLLALMNLSAFVLVFGGTIAATVISFRGKDLRAVGQLFRIAFVAHEMDPVEVIHKLVAFAEFARREGLLALEARLDELDDRFARSGLEAVVDGVDPELVKNLMETELSFLEDRHKNAASILEIAGGYAPTMGIMGTVMGLVHVLANLTNAAALGPAIATAFTATLYGIGTANLFWLPLAAKLKNRHRQEVLVREIMLEGILSIQAGENPRMLEEKLLAFLPPGDRRHRDRGGAQGGEQRDVAD